MSADYRLKQNLKMSLNAQVKNLVPETLTTIPAETEWKLGRMWFNSTIGRFQSVFAKIDESTNIPIEPQELEVRVLDESDKSITKISYAFKKLLGKEHTLASKKWYEEEDGIVLFQHAKEVWINKITETPDTTNPNFINSLIDFKITHDQTVSGRKVFYMREIDGTRMKGFIPSGYGKDFSIKVKIDGVLIPESHQSNYLFDYTNGILTFETTPPAGEITVDVHQYVGRTFAQYLDSENNSVAKGILGLDTSLTEYTIQHNMNSFDIDVIIYVYDDVDGVKYWKKDIIPLILLDENRVKLQLSEAYPIRFIIKSYENPNI